MAEAGPIKIMGAGLSGLAAATILAKGGREVHVHDIRDDSGARFEVGAHVEKAYEDAWPRDPTGVG